MSRRRMKYFWTPEESKLAREMRDAGDKFEVIACFVKRPPGAIASHLRAQKG